MKNGVGFEIPIDIALSPEKRIRVYSLIVEIIGTRNRIADDAKRMCLLLVELKEELEDDFDDVASEVFKIPRGSLYRYLRVGAGARVTSKGMEDPSKLLATTSQRALQLLDGADEDVLNEVRERAMRGELTNERLVRELISAKSKLEERLEEAQDQLSAQGRQLAELGQVKDSQIAQLEKQVNASRLAEYETVNVATQRQDRIESLSREICAYEAEVEKLRAELTQGKVVEKLVEKIPDNFKSMEEAIANRNQELDRINHAIADAKKRLAEAEAERDRQVEELSRSQQANGDVLSLQKDVHGLCERLSTTLVLRHALLTDESKQALMQMAASLAALPPTIRRYCGKESQ
ncbi:hypothetical protein ACU4GI_21720 [Cupriavidus basilensis]